MSARQHKPPLHRIKQHVFDMSRVGAVYWPYEGENIPASRYDDDGPSLEVYLVGVGSQQRGGIVVRDVYEHEYDAFMTAWEAAR